MNKLIEKYAREYADEYYNGGSDFYLDEIYAMEIGFQAGVKWILQFFPEAYCGEDNMPEVLEEVTISEEDKESTMLVCTKNYQIFTANKERKIAYRIWDKDYPHWRWVASGRECIKDEDVLFWMKA